MKGLRTDDSRRARRRSDRCFFLATQERSLHLATLVVSVARLARSTSRLVLAVIALTAAVAIALAIALSNGASTDRETPGVAAQPALRSDRGPQESGVAAAVAPRWRASPTSPASQPRSRVADR